eukprot:364952-Chlamydomonas_euryale.AAC.17
MSTVLTTRPHTDPVNCVQIHSVFHRITTAVADSNQKDSLRPRDSQTSAQDCRSAFVQAGASVPLCRPLCLAALDTALPFLGPLPERSSTFRRCSIQRQQQRCPVSHRRRRAAESSSSSSTSAVAAAVAAAAAVSHELPQQHWRQVSRRLCSNFTLSNAAATTLHQPSQQQRRRRHPPQRLASSGARLHSRRLGPGTCRRGRPRSLATAPCHAGGLAAAAAAATKHTRGALTPRRGHARSARRNMAAAGCEHARAASATEHATTLGARGRRAPRRLHEAVLALMATVVHMAAALSWRR